MIDWWNVLTHALWIVGLAIALAALSYTEWTSSRAGEGIAVTLKRIVREPVFLLGLALACLGAGLSVAVWWQRVLWFLLGAGLVISIARIHLSRQEDPTP